MNKIDYQALREAAEKAGEDKWQAKKINGDFFVIRHGSYTRQHGYTLYQPIAEIDCKPVRDFVAKANPATVLALLDERERNQQYIKRRDQENEDIALTVGKLRVELEETKSKLNEQREYYEGVISDGSKRIAELESGSQVQKLVEAIIVAIENEQERLFDEDYLMDSKECIDVIREEVKRWNDSRAAGIRIKGE
ncbi:ead/Ea22-like family protein [Escherichia coli]|uniref:ead/Ea22-like family protein n=1 Tax=Escherichia coli TaxID=562 RepID=UPI000BE5BF8C|nr:ead/Ea22-like family protein [Escherichia coli]